MVVARDTIVGSKSPPPHAPQPQRERESRSKTLFFLKLYDARVWVVNTTLRLFCHRDGTLVPIKEEDGRVTGQVRTGAEHTMGLEPRNLQPVGSRYTVYALPAATMFRSAAEECAAGKLSGKVERWNQKKVRR